MFGLSASHLIILAIVLLLFGARRLPEVGAGLGKGLRAFKSALEGTDVFDENPQRKSVAQQSRPEISADAEASSGSGESRDRDQANKA